MNNKNVKNNIDLSQYKKPKFVFRKNWPAFVDMLITKDLSKKRFNMIDKLDDNKKEVFVNYNVNIISKSLHPNYVDVEISNIINHDEVTKTFIFKPYDKNITKMPFFRAGQYVSITDIINGEKISRPYSISSSPKDALKGFYSITLKLKPNGYFSSNALSNWKIGTKLQLSGPEGEFYYDNIRDPKNILAIAGGSGITPFLSMAKAILEKTEDFYLTIIFGNRKKSNIFCYKELKDLEKQSDGKIKIINVLSEENDKECQCGLINLELIKKYLKPNSSIFMCGPKMMYKFVLNEIAPLNLLRKNIRIEASNEIGKPSIYSDYKNIGNKLTYKILVNQFGEKKEITADINDTILVSLQKAKITMQSKCLSGLCSWCRFKVIKGQIFTPKGFAHQRAADHKNKIYYSCSTFPITDLEIEAY